MDLSNKKKIIELLYEINWKYDDNLIKLKEVEKEFIEKNWNFLSKKKFFAEKWLQNLTSEQKYEMTGKQIDEYNANREKLYEEYEKKYNSIYEEFIKQKWITDFESIIEKISSDDKVLTKNQKELFEEILELTYDKKDFKVKTQVLKTFLMLITNDYSVMNKVEQEEKVENTELKQETQEVTEK